MICPHIRGLLAMQPWTQHARRSAYKLRLPYRSSIHGQKALSYLGPRLWNNLPADIKSNANVNTFRHDIKKLFFDNLQKKRGRYLYSVHSENAGTIMKKGLSDLSYAIPPTVFKMYRFNKYVLQLPDFMC